jgi:hypothetical protein
MTVILLFVALATMQDVTAAVNSDITVKDMLRVRFQRAATNCLFIH